MTVDVAIQKGHCFRRTGSIGTRGHRGTEQQFVDELGDRFATRLRGAGATVALLLADQFIPPCRVFVSLHQDGSISPTARGASFGYSTGGLGKRRFTPTDATLARMFAAHYTLAGWPSGFRPDNYTAALGGYYSWRKPNVRSSVCEAAVLIEHGFATNIGDANWMWDHLDETAAAHTAAVIQFSGPKVANTQGDDDMSKLYIDNGQLVRMGVGWHRFVSNGGQTPAEDFPGLVAYVIPDLEAAGQTVDVTDARNNG